MASHAYGVTALYAATRRQAALRASRPIRVTIAWRGGPEHCSGPADSAHSREGAIWLAVRLDGTSYAALAEKTGLTIRLIEREVARAIAQIDRSLYDRRPGHGWRPPPRGWLAPLISRLAGHGGEAVRTGIAPLG